MTPRTGQHARATLHALLGHLTTGGPDAAALKAAWLQALVAARFRSARDLQHLHRAASFLRAFPDTAGVHGAACRLVTAIDAHVARLPAGQRRRLEDSGLAGTVTRYRYPAVAARWLATRDPRTIDIDWRALDDPEALGLTVTAVLNPLEDEVTDFSGRGFERWLTQARGDEPHHATDLSWLLAQAPTGAAAAAFDREYDAANVPLVWRIGTATAAANAVVPGRVVFRTGMRRPTPGTDAIREPLLAIRTLPRRDARRLLDAWRLALWSRARTIFQIEQVDEATCRLADFGQGLTMGIAGVPPARRSPLEVTYGYVLLANGLPIGYGGFTTFFAQVNTGINVFPEFRGSEAAFAWQQALRTMRTLTGCARIVINPFQFGAGNSEALASGAYWFYHRLGFRSASPAIGRIADREAARMARSRTYRVPLTTLRRLAACDLHLDLESDADLRFVDESALDALGRGITAAFAREGAARRQTALAQMTGRFAGVLGIDQARWSSPERQGLALLAPLIAQVADLDTWDADERESLADLCRLRTAPDELPFVRQLRDHGRFREALVRAARAQGTGAAV